MRQKTLLAVGMAALLLVGGSVAQSLIGQQEDFEDDVVGENPTASWYTYSESTTGGALTGINVQTPGLDGTSKAFYFSSVSGSGGQKAEYIYDRQAFTQIEFFLECTVSNSNTQMLMEGDSTGVEDATLIGWTIDETCAIRTIGITDYCTTSPAGTLIYQSSPGAEMDINITVNWDTKQLTIDINEGAFTTVVSSCHMSALNIGTLEFRRPIANPSQIFLDQIKFDGGPLPVQEIPSPSEFDTGLLATVTGLGFKTPESQMLFSLVLIGNTTVSMGVMGKFISSGRLKNGLVTGVAVAVGLFCTFLFNLELWMFVVALVLGLAFVAGGAREIRNTFQDLRKAFTEENQPITTNLDAEPNQSVDAGVEPEEPEGQEAETSEPTTTPAQEPSAQADAPESPPPDEEPAASQGAQEEQT